MQTRYTSGGWEILKGDKRLVMMLKEVGLRKFYYRDNFVWEDTYLNYSERTIRTPINSNYHRVTYYYKTGAVYEYVYRTRDHMEIGWMDDSNSVPYYRVGNNRYTNRAEWLREIYNIIDQHE